MTYPVPSVSPVVELLSRFTRHGLALMAHAFDLCEHAQQIATKNLVNVLGAVAAIEQGLSNLRKISGRIDALRSRAAHAVKIGAKADMIYSRHFGNVVDVINEQFHRRTWNLRHPLAPDSVAVDISHPPAPPFMLVLILVNGARLVLCFCFHPLSGKLLPEATIKNKLQ